MTYHDWSDKTFPWQELSASIEIIRHISFKYGRIGGDIKEKFGCVRFYARFFDGTIHSLLYPGSVFIRYPRLYRFVDYPIIRRIFLFTRLASLIFWWQKKIYNIAYQKAIAKYPHLRNEILVDADYPEFIDNYPEFKSSDSE